MNYHDTHADEEALTAELEAAFRPLRVLVCGGRSFASWPAAGTIWRPTATERFAAYGLFSILDGLLDDAITSMRSMELVHGDCPRGADAIAAHWAASHPEVQVETHPADWDRFGRAAGPIRNQAMVDSLDPTDPHHLVVAAWDRSSRGTASTVAAARKRGLSVLEVVVA